MELLHVFILIYSAILLIEISSTTPIPENNKIFSRSIQKSPPHVSNFIDDGFKSKGSNLVLNDVHATIAQVQKILESDPTLPRLTRGEIEDLFEEVTKEEYEKSVKTGDLSRAKHMRALMLVLPYNTNHTSENDLQELYNRPPITKVISNEPKEMKKQKIVIPSGKVQIVNVAKQTPTTYKPSFRIKPLKTIPDPTTYHPATTTSTLSTTTRVFVTPTPPSTVATTSNPPTVSAKNRFSSHFSLQQGAFDPMPFKPIPTNPKPIDPELEDILKSLGFSAQSQTKKRSKVERPPPFHNEELSKRMLSSTLRQDSVAESFAFIPSSPSLAAKDFKTDLMPSISPRDFGTFKPIPESSGEVSPDLEAYLKQFGLYPPFESRSQKAIKPKSSKQSISKRIDENVADLQAVESKKSVQLTTKNSFKPTATNQDEEDFKQLQQLLKTLRELQALNATLSKEALEKLDPRHFNLSQSLLNQGPNPVLEPEFDLSKNEIKRQTESPEPLKFSLDLNLDDNSKGSSEITTTTTTTSTTTEAASTDASGTNDIDKIFVVTPEPAFNAPATSAITTTEEAPRNNVAELGDSFAGGLGDAENAEPLPPPRKNGFYFLSDWNSFLEVGEDPDKIVVRFDPKVGDPSRFIPVNVP